MAHCVVSRLLGGVAFCRVHEQPAGHGQSCPAAGRPADPAPLHADDRHGRVPTVAEWATRTDRQRPLVIHQGNLDSPSPAHETDGPLCWCRPEVIPPTGDQP